MRRADSNRARYQMCRRKTIPTTRIKNILLWQILEATPSKKEPSKERTTIGDSGLLAWDVSSCSTLPHYSRHMETAAGDAEVVLHELTTALLPTPQNHRSSWFIWLFWSRYCARQPNQDYQVVKSNQFSTVHQYLVPGS